jgi:RNA polymerase sigma-70 factor (ECF subfamily)
MNEKLIEHIELCRQGNRDAFGWLFDRYHRMVYTLAFRLLYDEEEAKDATQETFVKVWQQISRYLPAWKFSTWVCKIACNVCYDKLRSRRKVASVDASTCRLCAQVDYDDLLDNRTLKELLLKTTEGLSPKQKLVFTLSELEGLEADEIAKITNLSRAKIKSNLYLARQYIKTKLSHYEW